MMVRPSFTATPLVAVGSLFWLRLVFWEIGHDLVTSPSRTGDSKSELTVALAGGCPATDW